MMCPSRSDGLRSTALRTPRTLVIVLAPVLALTACDPAAPKPVQKPPTPAATGGKTDGGDADKPDQPGTKPDKPKPDKPKPKPKRDPNDPFDLEDPKVLFEILAAEELEGEAKLEVYRRYRLVDESGSPNIGRRRAWKAALTEFAAKHPDKWGEHYNAMEKARKVRDR